MKNLALILFVVTYALLVGIPTQALADCFGIRFCFHRLRHLAFESILHFY